MALRGPRAESRLRSCPATRQQLPVVVRPERADTARLCVVLCARMRSAIVARHVAIELTVSPFYPLVASRGVKVKRNGL